MQPTQAQVSRLRKLLLLAAALDGIAIFHVLLLLQAERLAMAHHPHIVTYLAHCHDSFGNVLLYTELGLCDMQQAGAQAAAKR